MEFLGDGRLHQVAASRAEGIGGELAVNGVKERDAGDHAHREDDDEAKGISVCPHPTAQPPALGRISRFCPVG
jgi:hypothetical protein